MVLDGEEYDPIPFGQEFAGRDNDPWSRPCNGITGRVDERCGARLGQRHHPHCALGRGEIYQRPTECRDCGAVLGEIHAAGCGIEICPRCRGQLMSCYCEGWGDEEDE